MRGWALTTVMLLVVASLARAGGSYYEESGAEFRPGLPYQRALIAFDGERELLILQSVYEFSGVRDQPDFAWILPLPGDARLHDVSEDWLKGAFWEVDFKTAPLHFSLLFGAGPYFCLGLALLIVLVAILKWKGRWGPAILSTLLVPAALWASLTIFRPEETVMRGVEDRDEVPVPGAVQLIPDPAEVAPDEGSGGDGPEEPGEPEDVSEGGGEPPMDIVAWLDAEGIAYAPADAAAFREREAGGLRHVVVRVSPTGGTRHLGRSSTGFCRTLAVEFSTREIVFPMALKEELGANTEVLIYVLGPHCVEGHGGLRTVGAVRQSGRIVAPGSKFNWERITSPFDRDPIIEQPWLTKLKGSLTPAELAKGLVLENAPADVEHLPRETRWK